MGHDALVRSNGDDMRCKCAMMYTYDVYMTKLVTITATTSSTRYVELFLTILVPDLRLCISVSLYMLYTNNHMMWLCS